MDYQKKLNFIMEYTRLRISQSVPKFIYEGEALALIDEIERLRQQNAELVEALNHCINALTEFEKDSNLPIEQFQYSVVFKLKGYLLGALDNARQVTGGE